MSVSSLSPPPPPPPSAAPSDTKPSDTNKPKSQDTQAQPVSDAFKSDKTGDEVAAAQQSSRPPLPPGQGTRVDILV